MISIPYNVFTCSNCKTAQIKYLDNINKVYKYNNATNIEIV